MKRRGKTQDRLLYLLKSKGPQTASELSLRVGVSAMAVRQHLYRFNRQGLVEFTDHPRPVGRPVRVWRITEMAGARFPNRHAELMLEMIRAVREVFGEEGLNRLLAERTLLQLREYCERIQTDGDDSLRGRVRTVTIIRRQQGYMAECLTRSDGTFLLHENHCPIRDAAASCPGLCREELALFQAILGPLARVERVEHRLTGGLRCSYVITPEPGSSNEALEHCREEQRER